MGDITFLPRKKAPLNPGQRAAALEEHLNDVWQSARVTADRSGFTVTIHVDEIPDFDRLASFLLQPAR